jgi:hypothetical protein
MNRLVQVERRTGSIKALSMDKDFKLTLTVHARPNYQVKLFYSTSNVSLYRMLPNLEREGFVK